MNYSNFYCFVIGQTSNVSGVNCLHFPVQGADMGAKDKDGHTARSLAYNKHHVRTVTLLDNALFIYRRMSGRPLSVGALYML